MNIESIALTGPGGPRSTTHAAHHGGRRGLVPFLGHFAEMLVAMIAGMALFGMALGSAFETDTELYALLMAASMTLPMVAWMRFRQHSWRASAEMAVAMVVPPVALFPLQWLGLISGDMLIGLQHVLMLPSMLAAMLYRRTDNGL